MASQTVTTLIDDIDGRHADQTVTFGLDGVAYEIDLHAANAAELRAIFAPYQQAARQAPHSPTPDGDTEKPGRPPPSARKRAAQIRAWARRHGIKVSGRGRIPAYLAAAYEANDPTQAKGPTTPRTANRSSGKP